MAEKKNRLGKLGNILTVGQWVWDRVQPYIAPAIGGGVMYYLSSVTNYLNTWGPFGWGVIGIASFLIVHGTLVAFAALRARTAMKAATAKLTERIAERSHINPLESQFRDKRIHLLDLATPTGEIIEHKKFENCDIIGPGVVIFTGCFLQRFGALIVEFVKTKSSDYLAAPNKTVFSHCTFIDCRLYNAVVLVPHDHAHEFQEGFPGGVVWIE